MKVMVQDRGDVGLEVLQERTDNMVRAGNQTQGLTGLFTIYKANSPQLFVDIDRDKCQQQGVRLGDVFATLQASLGSRYVNDFNQFGRTWQVIVQADGQYRDEVEDTFNLGIRNRDGRIVPLRSVATIEDISSPLVLTRYNMYPSAAINGNMIPGFSTGQGRAAVENLARRELPPTMA
ncbi:MAG: efflux RND transporter permease subunit, partial [Phycisphaerae bacterium]